MLVEKWLLKANGENGESKKPKLALISAEIIAMFEHAASM